jgi:ribosomal protein S25
MGGAKKKNLAQMEKQQVQQDKKDESAKKTKGKAERKAAGIAVPDFDNEKILAELSKIGALTPYSIATQFNVRLSVARDILEELERRRLITSVGGNTRIKIFKLAAA